MTDVPFQRLPAVFARLRGRNDCVREFNALVSPASDFSIVPKVDAYRLGYPEAARDDPVTDQPNLFRGVTYSGYWEGMLISMKEVAIGRRSVYNVDFIAYDLPQTVGFDVVLGRSFLAATGISINYEENVVRIRKREGSE